MTKNIILIGNPIAGGGALKKIKRAVNILENRGFDVRLMLTAQKGDAELFARQISQESEIRSQECLVIAAGGDGTYNEVANGLVHSNIPMAILPLGTTCVLAKELNVPEDPERALDIAMTGKAQAIHLGRITTASLTRHFLLMAGIGFDGETVCGVNPWIKKITGKGAYILSGIKTILRYNPSQITLKYDSEQRSGYNAIIGKASCYGGDFKITPDAKLTEPSFYVFLMHQKGRLNLIRYISGIIKGGHLKLKDISYFRASEIEIQGNAHIQIDGDYLGTTPAKIDVAPDALRLVTSTL
ncbi:MAG: diacylglycerol/lipid kinase family protein [Nitrospirota bacterium]